ncbi:putative PLC-like phosphodiesterase, TIM beta/alpha-barrel domain superfamily [Septoria linicola]|nr:putative PLC-like phosphodiesterase, TIM beta/alpha-barrel domain superfamily [Septoria linicola]
MQTVSAQTACNNSPDICDRSYSNISYLGAHGSPFLRDETTGFSTSGNQFYNTTRQLAAGVRLVSAQIQNPNDTSSDLDVCHTSCSLLDAGTLESWLSEIKTWMDANVNDVVTVLIVNGASATASQIAAAYTSAGMDEHAYTPSSTSANDDWPTLQTLISAGTRSVNFVANLDDNTGATYLLNEFTYVVENDYDNSSPADFSCEVNRPSSLANQTASAISSGHLTLVNHFLYENQLFGIQSPNETYSPVTNSPGSGVGTLGSAASDCTAQYGKAPTFFLVDFFNVGPAIEVVDSLNGITATGRTTLPAALLSETSGGTMAAPKISTVLVGLSTAFLACVMW